MSKKQVQESPQLWEGFGATRRRKPPASTEPLLPPLRSNPWPLIVPLVLIVLVLGVAFYGYSKYIAPEYEAERDAYETTLAVAEEYEGQPIKELEKRDDCYAVLFEIDNSIHSLCVTEELWNEQKAGEPFDVSLLRKTEADELGFPW